MDNHFTQKQIELLKKYDALKPKASLKGIRLKTNKRLLVKSKNDKSYVRIK